MKTPPEMNPVPSEDKRPRRSQMSMESPLTREQFKAREIEQPAPLPEEVIASNTETMDAVREQHRAMTVKGRKRQREKLRKKLGLEPGPVARGVKAGTPIPRLRQDEVIEDKLYAVGKPVDQAE